MKARHFIGIVALVLGMSVHALAQDCGSLPPCDGSGGEVPGTYDSGTDTYTPSGATCCSNVTVPFDGGVSLMVLAGVSIGAFMKRKK